MNIYQFMALLALQRLGGRGPASAVHTTLMNAGMSVGFGETRNTLTMLVHSHYVMSQGARADGGIVPVFILTPRGKQKLKEVREIYYALSPDPVSP